VKYDGRGVEINDFIKKLARAGEEWVSNQGSLGFSFIFSSLVHWATVAANKWGNFRFVPIFFFEVSSEINLRFDLVPFKPNFKSHNYVCKW
jgi:hypothetical protein